MDSSHVFSKRTRNDDGQRQVHFSSRWVFNRSTEARHTAKQCSPRRRKLGLESLDSPAVTSEVAIKLPAGWLFADIAQEQPVTAPLISASSTIDFQFSPLTTVSFSTSISHNANSKHRNARPSVLNVDPRDEIRSVKLQSRCSDDGLSMQSIIEEVAATKQRTQARARAAVDVAAKLKEVLASDALLWHTLDPRTCSAALLKDRTKRCTNKARCPILTKDLITLLRGLVGGGDSLQMLDSVNSILTLVLCGRHIKSGSSRLAELGEGAESSSTAGKAENSQSLLDICKSWIRMILRTVAGDATSDGEESDSDSNANFTVGTSLQQLMASPVRSRVKTRSMPAATRSQTAPRVQPKTSRQQGFLPSENEVLSASIFTDFRPHPKIAVHELLLKKLMQPMTKEDLQAQYLYVYWYPGNFGLVKIGVTKNVEERLEQWRKQCRHPIQPALDKGVVSRVKIPNGHRAEQLIHAELRDFRKKEQCGQCKRNHIEWFQTSEQHVKRVIRKWTLFFSSAQRYEQKVGGQLDLDVTTKKQIQQFCFPIPKPAYLTITTEPLQARPTSVNSRPSKGPTERRRSSNRLKTEHVEALSVDGPETKRRKSRAFNLLWINPSIVLVL